VDAILASVWSAERLVSPRGREVRRTSLPASPRDLTGVSGGAYAAHAQGPTPDEWAVDARADRQHRSDWTRHDPCHGRRGAGSGSTGPVSRAPRCASSTEVIAKALTGHDQPEHVLALKQALALYDAYTNQVRECDGEIEGRFQAIKPVWTDELPRWTGRTSPPLTTRMPPPTMRAASSIRWWAST
jgi:hypothetical protein